MPAQGNALGKRPNGIKPLRGGTPVVSPLQGWKVSERGEDEHGRAVRKGFSRARVDEVLAKKGKLTWGELLRCRVRYFTDGAVLGSKEFVNSIFTAERHRFGAQRKSGARPLRGVDLPELCALRDLRVQVIG
jgi:hypothetical protein